MKRVLLGLASALTLLSAAGGASGRPVFSRLPAQPAGTPWPTLAWQRTRPPVGVDRARLDRLLDGLMRPGDSLLGRTFAVTVVHRGRIVAERYAPGEGCDRIGHTMSVGKMMGAAMAGRMTADGLLRLDDPTGLPYWPRGDARRAITLRHVLNMTTGLEWVEEGGASFLDLAFGSGYRDLARFTAEKPLVARPGAKFVYSDGTPSLVGDMLRRRLRGDRSAVARYVRTRILEPVGMRRTELEFDAQGTWYGSSGVRWSPCDLARFGLLLARDGRWDGREVLPAGWVNFMRTPSSASLRSRPPAGAPEDATLFYGALSFVWDLRPSDLARPGDYPVDAFGHYGFGGNALRVVPSRDVVLVVFGAGADEERGFLKRKRLFKAITDLFPSVSAL